jgi:DNA-binding response OmpR family regulator
MRILIADDEPSSRRILELALKRWGFEVVTVEEGTVALSTLQADDGPRLAVLDWMMPGLDGVEVCRRLRSARVLRPLYLILLTAKTDRDDIVAGLNAGADDYITKPFDTAELKARIDVGQRVVQLQHALNERVQELEEALEHIRTLQGLIHICMHCHKILDDQKSWQALEKYIEQHSEAKFSHGLCPECLEKHYGQDL